MKLGARHGWSSNHFFKNLWLFELFEPPGPSVLGWTPTKYCTCASSLKKDTRYYCCQHSISVQSSIWIYGYIFFFNTWFVNLKSDCNCLSILFFLQGGLFCGCQFVCGNCWLDALWPFCGRHKIGNIFRCVAGEGVLGGGAPRPPPEHTKQQAFGAVPRNGTPKWWWVIGKCWWMLPGYIFDVFERPAEACVASGIDRWLNVGKV